MSYTLLFVLAAIYVITALVQNLLSIVWSVYMARAWLRPPVNSFCSAAVPLPAIVISLILVATRGRKQRKMCLCIDLKDGEKDKSHQTLDSELETESVKSEHGAEPVNSIANQCSQGEQPIRAMCLWHSSLDNTDRLLFLMTLLSLVLCVFVIMIVLPYKQSYY